MRRIHAVCRSVDVMVLLIVGAIIVSLSCNVTSYSINCPVPPEILLPSNINKVAIINRANPEKRQGTLEGIITGEAPLMDRKIAQDIIKELHRNLSSHPWYKFNIYEGGEEVSNKKPDYFSTPLDTSIVFEVCRKSNSDGILSLEFYDTDVERSLPVKQEEETTDPKTKKPVKKISFSQTTLYKGKAGFRIYDCSSGMVIHEDIITGAAEATTTSATPLPAVISTTAYHEPTISKIPIAIASTYSSKFFIQFLPFTTNLYKGKGEELKECAALIIMKEFNKAIDFCSRNMENEYLPKIKSRLAKNTAIAYESLSLDKDWAEQIPLLDSAINYTKLSIYFKPTYDAERYLIHLQERRQMVSNFLKK